VPRERPPRRRTGRTAVRRHPRISTATDVANRTPSSHVDPAEQWADTCKTSWCDFALDGDRLLGRPRAAVGYVGEVTGDRLAEWARADTPA
jgi:hypothetical protein